MAAAPTKHGRDQAMDFQGFLNDLQDWELKLNDKDKRRKPLASDKVSTAESSSSGSGSLLRDYASSIGSVSDENAVDATSEKDLGNEYFKQKKFVEAIECYSRSIAFSPTAVAYANRAMAYIKTKRFQEAEDDCTEALNLDDRYIKAYSRRATARKELGKVKESMEDSEFALRLEPNNQEIKKQYNDAKSLYEKKLFQKVSAGSKSYAQPAVKLGRPVKVNGVGEASVSRPSQTAGSVQKDKTKENDGALGGNGILIQEMETLSSVTANRTERRHVSSREAPTSENVQDWELKLNDKDKRRKPLASDEKAESSSRGSGSLLRDYAGSIGSVSDENAVDATSEKDLGNEYFKQKKFVEAIECYSRSIAFSPTAVAYANRAMAYIKTKRFQEAEDDCTEALNLDDRYIKAYSRRATARKELGKVKESMEDSEFALRLEPNNLEIKKQYNDAKSLYEKKLFQKVSAGSKSSAQPAVKLGRPVKVNGVGDASVSRPSQTAGSVQKDKTKGNDGALGGNGIIIKEVETISSVTANRTERRHVSSREAPSSENVQTHPKNGTLELKPSVHDLASRAASRAKTEAAKNIMPPTSAYQFEASWRKFSGDSSLQTSLLKVTPPTVLPRIFKNSLSAPMLIDIIKCVSTFFRDDVDLAVKYLENLTKVPRFSMLVMSLSTQDRTDLHNTWKEVFCSEATPVEYAEILDGLRSMYCIR